MTVTSPRTMKIDAHLWAEVKRIAAFGDRSSSYVVNRMIEASLSDDADELTPKT